jgi:hypothetical protein
MGASEASGPCPLSWWLGSREFALCPLQWPLPLLWIAALCLRLVFVAHAEWSCCAYGRSSWWWLWSWSSSMRQLKYHEKKLLKKVDFLQWKSDDNIREAKILRRYLIQKREDYIK